MGSPAYLSISRANRRRQRSKSAGIVASKGTDSKGDESSIGDLALVGPARLSDRALRESGALPGAPGSSAAQPGAPAPGKAWAQRCPGRPGNPGRRVAARCAPSFGPARGDDQGAAVGDVGEGSTQCLLPVGVGVTNHGHGSSIAEATTPLSVQRRRHDDPKAEVVAPDIGRQAAAVGAAQMRGLHGACPPQIT